VAVLGPGQTDCSAVFAVVVTDLGCHMSAGPRLRPPSNRLRHRRPVVLLTGWGLRLAEDGDVPPHVDRVLNKPPKLAELRVVLGELTPTDRRVLTRVVSSEMD
jgi:hypothetical protein